MSDSSQPHGLQPTRLLLPWDFPGKSPGVGCHCLKHIIQKAPFENFLRENYLKVSLLFVVRAIFESLVNEVILGPFGMDLQILSCLLSDSIKKEKRKN